LASISLPRQHDATRDLKWQITGACERVFSAGLLAALSPVVALSAAGIGLLSRRTPLIAHRRVGWRGETLWMLKLRTMWGRDADGVVGKRRGLIEYIDDTAGPDRKQAADPRVASRFARFCRLHSIDEIPQLWHVVRGEMSLVGPRPVTGGELRRYYGGSVDEVLEHKPGIAGLWQVSGRNRLTYAERRALDLELVRGRSLLTYFKVLLKTVPEVFNGKNTF
jgi:lipopolysaccharide/colanic/teichoic acid biosynthesis glycosyltransferase